VDVLLSWISLAKRLGHIRWRANAGGLLQALKRKKKTKIGKTHILGIVLTSGLNQKMTSPISEQKWVTSLVAKKSDGTKRSILGPGGGSAAFTLEGGKNSLLIPGKGRSSLQKAPVPATRSTALGSTWWKSDVRRVFGRKRRQRGV